MDSFRNSGKSIDNAALLAKLCILNANSSYKNTFQDSTQVSIGLCNFQIKYLVQYLEGKVRLPSEAERWKALQAQESESDMNGIPVHMRLRLGVIGESVFSYLQSLMEDAEFSDRTKNMLALKKVIFAIDLTRLFDHIELFRNDKLQWIDDTCATYYCSPDPDGKDEAELLTLKLNPGTGEVSISSSLGKVHNNPYPV